jgi:predicted transglutaminase-like cysteine proteinase
MGKSIAVLMTLFLIGCASPKQTITITNESVEAPYGYTEYCKREPESNACKEKK